MYNNHFKPHVRRLLVTALIVTGTLASASAMAETTLTVTGYYGIFQDRFTEAVIKPFMAANPGINVVYRPVKNSAEAMAALRLQRDRPSIDVAIVDISVATMASREKLFGPLDPAQVPNLDDIAPWGRPAGNMGAALTHDNLALIYNTAQVKQPLLSWKDLWKPEFKGRLGMPIADTRGVVLIPILTRMHGGDYKKDITPAIEDLKKLAPSVQTWDPQPAVYEAAQSGLISIGIGFNARGQYIHDQSKGLVGVAIPQEGSVSQINTINLVGNSQHSADAQKFINYALSAPVQVAFAKASFYGPTNTKAKLDTATDLRINGTVASQQNAMQLDWNWVTTRYTPWITRIKREVIAP